MLTEETRKMSKKSKKVKKGLKKEGNQVIRKSASGGLGSQETQTLTIDYFSVCSVPSFDYAQDSVCGKFLFFLNFT